MMKFAVLALCLGAAIAAPTDTYPTTAPIENENTIPVMFAEGKPSLDFDDTDPGGYIYYYGYMLSSYDGTIDMDDINVGYAPQMNGFMMYNTVFAWHLPPVDPPETWNCTATGLVYVTDDFSGVIDGNTICEVGECCDNLMGNVKWSDGQIDSTQWLSDRVAANFCGELVEDLYCVYLGSDFNLNCWEYWFDPVDRIFIIPCHDVMFVFHSNCRLFKITYPISALKEPPLYYGSMTNAQVIAVEAYQQQQDHVCHPYSYYVPTCSKDDTSGCPTATDGVSQTALYLGEPGKTTGGAYAVEQPETVSESAAFMWAPAFVVAALALF